MVENWDLIDSASSCMCKEVIWSKTEPVEQEVCEGHYCHLVTEKFLPSLDECIICQSTDICLGDEDCCSPCTCDLFDAHCRIKDSYLQ